jgi:hypothetical protein
MASLEGSAAAYSMYVLRKGHGNIAVLLAANTLEPFDSKHGQTGAP